MVASLSQENAHLLTVSTPSSSSSSRDQISIARVISRAISELERLGFLTVCFNCKHLSPAANSVPLLPTKKKTADRGVQSAAAELEEHERELEAAAQGAVFSISLCSFHPHPALVEIVIATPPRWFLAAQSLGACVLAGRQPLQLCSPEKDGNLSDPRCYRVSEREIREEISPIAVDHRLHE